MPAENAGSIYAEVRIRLDKLRADIAQTTARMDGLERDVTTATASMEKKAKANFSAMSVAAVAASALIAASFRSLITSTAQYGQAISDVQAATRGTAQDLANLEQAAASAGDELATSTTDALGAVEALAKAGVSTADIMGGALPGALTLAAAGSMNVADAAEIAAATMTQFGLAGGDVVHIADLLAAGAGKAQGEVSDLSMALKQSGLVAAQTGLKIEDTVGALAAFASAGLLGSDAGTSFRTMLLRLTPQSKEAADEMKRLGIEAFDANGEFIGLSKYAQLLQDRLSGLTTEQRNAALATVFGSDSIRAANILYTQGAKGIDDWKTKVNDAGYAADVAKIKLDNLNGDLKALGAATTDTASKIGDGLSPVLRGVTQFLTSFVDLIGKADPALSSFVVTILATGAALVGVNAGLGLMGISLAAITGPIGLAVAGLTVLTAGIVSATAAVNAANVSKAEKEFGDIGTSSGVAASELKKFAQKASDAEQFLRTLSAEGRTGGKAFEQLAKDMGLTNDQLAQIALRSKGASAEVKTTARGYLDGAAAAKRFAEANALLGITLRDSWRTATPAEVKKVEDALKSLGTSVPIIAKDVNEFTDAELTEFADRYKATAAQVADIVGFMRNDRAKEEAQREAEIIATNEGIIGSYAYSQARIRDIIEARMHQTTADVDADTRKQEEANVKLASTILDDFSGLASALGDIFSSIYQRQIDEATNAYDKERELIENNGLTKKQALEKSLADAQIAGDAKATDDAQRALDLYNIESDFIKKKAQLEYESAMASWRLQVVQAASTTAQAAINAYSSAMTAGPFALPTLGLYLAALSPLAGLIGTITTAQPQPPKFETGGIVLGNSTTGDKVPALVNSREMILTQEQQAQLFAMANGSVANGGATVVVPVYLDGKVIAQSTAKLIDNGVVKMQSVVK